jgi:hypothetical protein
MSDSATPPIPARPVKGDRGAVSRSDVVLMTTLT